MDYATALFYTLSTIAQTLAGALAVLVAFVLFRLNDLDKRISAGRNALRKQGATYPESWVTLTKHGLAALETFLKGKVTLHPDDAEHCEQAYAALLTRPVLIGLIEMALHFTAADIALCFVALPFTPVIARSRAATWVVLALAVILAIACLLIYVSLIKAVVKRIVPDPPTSTPAPSPR